MGGLKHTPGPWFRSGVRQKVGHAGDSHSVCATVNGKELIIASVWYDPKTHAGFHDAGLIAAAPELLAALKEAAEFIQPFNRADELLEQIDAAIAKATGQ